jgi:selenocysteine lyase/cysteine desulfurase
MTLAIPTQTSSATSDRTIPAVVGADLRVPLVDGSFATYVNLDHAASAPALTAVKQAIDEFLPYYASVHRGAGYCSQVSTKVYEKARGTLRYFVGGREKDAVIFTRNSTDSLNLLARSVPKGTSVVVFDTEHHAALLPWRGTNVQHVQTPGSIAELPKALAEALATTPVGPRLVVLCGASNVTGEIWPVAELARVAHASGARVVLDAAQLAPHRPVDISRDDIDYVVLSGHKLYAPFGAGALIGRADWLDVAQPYLIGGGATSLVSQASHGLTVKWSKGEAKHEAGSPNVVGVYAFAVAAKELAANSAAIIEHEQRLSGQLRAGFATVPEIRTLSLFDDAESVGVVSFSVDGYDADLVAAVLSAEHGIGVRDGAFCAHVATHRLLDASGTSRRTAVRVSLGLGTSSEHISRLLTALRELVANGPAVEYAKVDGKWTPATDTRPLPGFLLD